MKICISAKQKQWLWFIILWLVGLGAITMMSYIIKLIMSI
jgi:hypothetical protein